MNSPDVITIFHGSEEIIRKPLYGIGNPRNDYGRGFYGTLVLDLAKEWACTETHGGYANKYNLDLGGLHILNLSDGQYNILHWLSLLLKNRIFDTRNAVSEAGRQYLIEHFDIDTSNFDIIRGYRADDSYFSFAQAFLDNTITVRKLAEAMHLGKLGEQIVLVSPNAFAQIEFIGFEPAERDIFYPLRKSRDEFARSRFFSLRDAPGLKPDDLFLADIIRGGITADDPRLQ
ncbi:MAG: DUF3990 domain-containing protein [Spirochaetales bacterium]|nr:DUF3990 domain-containing protein [Spirochaetales bacterium]